MWVTVGSSIVSTCMGLSSLSVTDHSSAKKPFNHFLVVNTCMDTVLFMVTSNWLISSLGCFPFDIFSTIDFTGDALLVFPMSDCSIEELPTWRILLNVHFAGKVEIDTCSLCWYCSRYPISTPLGCPGGVQWRVISVSDGLSRVRVKGGPGTSKNTKNAWW